MKQQELPRETDDGITVRIPLRLPSLANLREHWTRRARRAKEHRGVTRLLLSNTMRPPELPLIVTFTRVAPRQLDSDNLAISFKAVRDGVADWLGIDDADERINWRYRQRSADRAEVLITFRRRDAS